MADNAAGPPPSAHTSSGGALTASSCFTSTVLSQAMVPSLNRAASDHGTTPDPLARPRARCRLGEQRSDGRRAWRRGGGLSTRPSSVSSSSAGTRQWGICGRPPHVDAEESPGDCSQKPGHTSRSVPARNRTRTTAQPSWRPAESSGGPPSVRNPDIGGAGGDLAELNGWCTPHMLERYGACARRSYNRITTDDPQSPRG
jgi:hypothetical protein